MEPALVLPDEFKLAIDLFNQKKINLRELIEARKKFAPGLDVTVRLPLSTIMDHNGKFVIYDQTIDRNPKYPEGDNQTRKEFTYSPNYHPKGVFFCDWKSKMVIPSINLAHKAILKGYDIDAYVFDDEGLQAQYQHFRNYIKENFRHAQYKTDFMIKIIEIAFFIIKEDCYYRRLIDMMETMPRFGLRDYEKENIAKWH